MFARLRKRLLNGQFLLALVVEVIATVLVNLVTCLL
jgi:hypothetical protein